MVKITWTDEALKWLKDIYDYIAVDSVKIANRVIKEILEKAEILENFPLIG